MSNNECSQPASKSSWDSQDFGDVNLVLKMAHFHKSTRPQWLKLGYVSNKGEDATGIETTKGAKQMFGI